jgi:hypothetical protein
LCCRGGYRISYYPQKLQDWVGAQSSSEPVGTTFQRTVSSTTLSPDGLPNYGLRSVPKYVAGVNTPNSIIDITDTRLQTRGFSANFMDPHLPDPRVHDWNFTVEKEIAASTVARLGYIGNAGRKQQQTYELNASTPSYIWYVTERRPLPTGAFSSVATRPYDQEVWGNINRYEMTGYSNHHGFQAEIERRYKDGLGFQLFWVLSNTLTSGASVNSNTVPGLNTFLPGAVPTDPYERNRFLNYGRCDSRCPNAAIETPKHEIRWNWIADLPFGQGKKIGGNASGLLEKIIGGWQIAGLGRWRTNYAWLPNNIYPTTGNDFELYRYQYPIEDCRSGVCFPGYLFWNGYIPENQINSFDANGKPNGVMGVPANYKPAGQPLIPWGSTELPPHAPAGTNVSNFWDTNTVWVPLDNGTVQRTTFNDNMHPWRDQYFPGVGQWFQDASLFKFINLTERVTFRLNVDFFNVFNNQNNQTGSTSSSGGNGIGPDGILQTRNSGTPARVTQISLRLMW